MISNEKRAFKRASHKFAVKFKKNGDTSVKTGFSVTENISLGGMYFVSLEKLDIGTLLDCEVEAGAAGTCSYVARVVRCEELEKHMLKTFGVAVEFMKAEGDSDRRLKAVL